MNPTKYQERFCDDLIEHMSTGLSFESFAGVCSVARATLYNWRSQNPEFLTAQELGLEKCRLFWEKKGIEGLFSSKESGNLNTGVWFINMRNRFGWRSANSPEAPIADDNEDDIHSLWEKTRSER